MTVIRNRIRKIYLFSLIRTIIKKIIRYLGYEVVHIPTKEKSPKIPIAQAIPLTTAHIKNCKIILGRSNMFEYLPKNSICAEVGIWKCNFSKEIIAKTQPKELHLIDFNEELVYEAKQVFKNHINKTVFCHLGNSFEELDKFPNNYFDWIFIDATHSYDFVKKDLSVARFKTKKEGFIIAHDYIMYDHLFHVPCGVVHAVNEFCIQNDYEIIFMALEPNMFNTVVLRAMS